MIISGVSTVVERLPIVSCNLNTELDVSRAAQEAKAFNAGLEVVSRFPAQIGFIETDITELDELCGDQSYDPGYNAELDVPLAGPFRFANTAFNEHPLGPAYSPAILESSFEALEPIIDAFGNIVSTDLLRHGFNLNPSALSRTGELPVSVHVGLFERTKRTYLHTDVAFLPGYVALKYVMSLGVSGTGFVSMPVRKNGAHEYAAALSPDDLSAMDKMIPAPGAISRFVKARDAHFSPFDKGFRVFMASEVLVIPPGSAYA